jgi:TIR domain/Predicted nucleotide-binding protein containing TIR-like domain
MPANNRYLFVSYAREDLERVRPLVDAVREELAFRALPVDVWMDISNLRPGEEWNAAIAEALEASIGFLFFLSPRSLRSAWVRREVQIAATASGRLIIPVMLHEPLDVPPILSQWQWLRFVGRPNQEDTANAAAQIADATERYLRATPKPSAAVTKADAPAIAADIARDVRSSAEGSVPEGPPATVFVVHGHDSDVLTQLEEFLDSVGIESIVLSRQDESPQSLFQKFMTIGGRARFAIVLLGADDYGASRRHTMRQESATGLFNSAPARMWFLSLGFSMEGLAGRMFSSSTRVQIVSSRISSAHPIWTASSSTPLKTPSGETSWQGDCQLQDSNCNSRLIPARSLQKRSNLSRRG